ncbi:unnamed protein product [Cyprideis torosa]|uniref:DNA topoisomerase (ATP-hydrolyzing) n=1 Tax=Cyprideis torosa TaxID=163714 RepID=A0A7R8ZRJ2_9CRUS|nr:unnamed protein product [Cyprideis torosa]CAG0899125.1 unnamed protein product [Cyprideis torosa]
MVQDFSLRYPLVDGQGNFGSVDGDSPAAMRYTEARLMRISEEILRDLDKNTVDFASNFDDSLQEPTVMPAYLPSLLLNGASGIAVGMATNIPPHNLTEVVSGLVAMIDKPVITNEELMEYVTAPDFPTGGIIFGYEGVKSAYTTGRGKVVIRARANVESHKNDRESIIITELPFQVNKANLIEKIADLVRDGKVQDISNIRDESDRDGMRVVIETKRGSQPEVIINQLFKHTQMQVTFGVIMLALVNGSPKVLTLRETMEHFLAHRMEVLIRRTQYELDAAERRAHILEGYIIALDNIDEVIETIKKSKDVETAKTRLMSKFKLSEIQAKAILDMRLQRLTGLERKKIEDEYKEIIKLIEKLRGILDSERKRNNIIKDELIALRERYGDARRTEVIKNYQEFSLEDIIAEEDVVVTISHSGFIKRFPVSGYRKQARGGRGVTGDKLIEVKLADGNNDIVIGTKKGLAIRFNESDVREMGRTATGVRGIRLGAGDIVIGFLVVRSMSTLLVVTNKGFGKRSSIDDYRITRRGGKGVITVKTGEKTGHLISIMEINDNDELVIITNSGMVIRQGVKKIRVMGRATQGVKLINLKEADSIADVAKVVSDDEGINDEPNTEEENLGI